MKKYNVHYILALITYIVVNLLSITKFPFVHSDETWLAGLSKTIFDYKTFIITEPFFDLFPRQPHTIKSLFHLLQGHWMNIFGYGIVQIRLLSFIVGMMVLVILYGFLKRKHSKLNIYISHKNHLPFLLTAFMAISLQFIYASHFARQEIIILLFMVCSYIIVDQYVISRNALTGKSYTPITALCLLTGLAIGFHPNSFLIACVVGSLLFYNGVITKSFNKLLLYILGTGSIASIYVALSISWNNNFISAYSTFGDSLGATASLLDKIHTFPIFLYKLFYGISATYYTPDIRIEMILFVFLIVLTGLALIFKRLQFSHEWTLPLLACLALTVGLILIGRYNATSIVFYLPFLVLLLNGLITSLLIGSHTYKPLLFQSLLSLIILISMVRSGSEIIKKPLETYDAYINEIQAHIPSESKSLCNLNAGFAFEPNQFLDVRNLTLLSENKMTVGDYIHHNAIDYIVLSEELSYIYRNQDPWSIVYGRLDYYPELMSLIDTQFTPIHTFESPQYGMRIVDYNDGYPWEVVIYKKTNPDHNN